MSIVTLVSAGRKILFLSALGFCLNAHAQSNVTVRVMAANITSGTGQSYETAGIDIFQGLKPDIVAIQEFRYNSSSASNNLRTLVDAAFGPNYTFFCQSGFNIPNGIVSRYPILASGSWTDSLVSDRSFAWAQIDLPGTNDLYVVSVHLYSSGTATDRNTEANEVKTQIQSNFPENAWVIVAGDFNTSSRSEACVSTFKTFLSDAPVPTDNSGDADTNEPRNKPYDYLLPSFSMTNRLVASVIGSQNFNGLVFDSAVFTPLSDVSPVAAGDSHVTGMQHMAVIKDFSIASDDAGTNPPAITAQPSGRTNAVGATISIAVTATGSGPLNYQWRFNGTNLAGATANPLVLASAQLTNSGNYSVMVTNTFGSVTSSAAALLITNAPPAITTPPQSQFVLAGQSATFSVAATGTPPLNYQWLLGGTNISGATTNPLVLANVQSTNAGNYSVVISNFAGSVTSSAAALTIVFTNPAVFAQWNFNSVPPDGSTSTGSTAPSIGTGTASLVGGATATFATGDTTFDPVGTNDNSGWNTATYPAQGTGSKTRGIQFAVSTAGKQNIVVTWTSESPNTGSKYGRLQYSADGLNFTDFSVPFINGTGYTVKTNSLAGISGVNNNTNFAFRFVSEWESTAANTANANYVGAGGSYGTGGTMRYDMVTVSGTSFIAAAPAVLDSPAMAGNQFGFTVSGSAGLNYIVQSSTNLTATNWIPIFTNTAPFPFGDTDLSAPQKFYRAVAQ